jgi:hypothetical protein
VVKEAMPLLVTSASGANGNGFGALLAFESDGGCAEPLLMMIALSIRVALPWIQRKNCCF